MIAHPDKVIPGRQVLAFGRVSDAVRGTAVSWARIVLEYRVDGQRGRLPVQINFGPGGWFAAHLPAAALAGGVLAASAQIDVLATITAPGYRSVTLSRRVAGSHFVTEQIDLAHLPGQRLTRWAGEALDFSAALDPPAVALRGVVIHDHDPAQPVGAATVTVSPAPAVTADGAGRFFISALPLTRLVQITVSDGANEQTHQWPVDFGHPVNSATLSLTRSNVEDDNA